MNRLKKLIAWRKENNIDHILENEVVKKVGSMCVELVIRIMTTWRNAYCTRLTRQIATEEFAFFG